MKHNWRLSLSSRAGRQLKQWKLLQWGKESSGQGKAPIPEAAWTRRAFTARARLVEWEDAKRKPQEYRGGEGVFWLNHLMGFVLEVGQGSSTSPGLGGWWGIWLDIEGDQALEFEVLSKLTLTEFLLQLGNTGPTRTDTKVKAYRIREAWLNEVQGECLGQWKRGELAGGLSPIFPSEMPKANIAKSCCIYST